MEETILQINENSSKLIIYEPNNGFIIENPSSSILEIIADQTQLNIPIEKISILSVGIQGVPGVGADKHFVHVQTLASAIWVVVHSLEKKPSVTVVDSGDSVVIGDVTYDSLDQLTITFTAPFGGRCYLN